MDNHSIALVPIEAWAYCSPEISMKGSSIDIGLFCEALIYYERIYVTFANENQFLDLLQWFAVQGQLDNLIALIEDGTIYFYYYAFMSAPVLLQNKHFSIVNLQDEEQEKANYFLRKIYENHTLADMFFHSRKRKKFYRVIEDRIIEVKASSYGKALDGARIDLGDSKKCELLLKSFLEDICPPDMNIPEIEAKTNITLDHSLQITWNLDLESFTKRIAPQLNFSNSNIFSAAVQSNRTLWSAANLNSDLYLGSPISKLIGNKLYATGQYLNNQKVIERLQGEVFFPDVRSLINSGDAGFSLVMDARKRGKKFRTWLQSQNGRDIQALVTYHNEIAREAGWQGSKALKLFGSLSGAAIGAHYGNSDYAIAGAVAGSSLEFIADLGSKFVGGWKPIAFGNWLGDQIHRLYKNA